MDKLLNYFILPLLAVLVLGVLGLGVMVRVSAHHNTAIYQDQLMHDTSNVLEQIAHPTSWVATSFTLKQLNDTHFLQPVVLTHPEVSGIVTSWRGKSVLLAGFPHGVVAEGVSLDFYLCPLPSPSATPSKATSIPATCFLFIDHPAR